LKLLIFIDVLNSMIRSWNQLLLLQQSQYKNLL